jgi:hypothetical protein
MTRESGIGKTMKCDYLPGVACGLLLIAVSALVFEAGCGESSSPAATTTAAATQPEKSTSATANPIDPGNAKIDSAPVATAPPTAITTSSAEAGVSPAGSPTSGSNGPARDISFDTIKFNMQKDETFQRSMITPAIEQIGNTKIRIRGYILPSFQQTGLQQFVLVRDNMQCCFGPGAALYDCVVVQMNDGHTADFTTRPVAVEGVFSIQEIANPEGKCLAIYHLQANQVQ